jgi:hypothetical protein
MKIELTKEVAIALLKSVKPYYSVMNQIPKELGNYVGGFVDDWKWNNISIDIKYTAEELYAYYELCKNSWK